MKINQNHFTVFLVVLTAVIGYFAGQISGSNLQIVATKLINGSLTLVIPSIFIYYLRGTKYDVYAEIFDNKNIAAAIIVGLAWLSVALSFTVVS